MKIIKEGKIPIKKEITYRNTCPNCGTIYEYNDKDVYQINNISQYFRIEWTICPLCKKENQHYKKYKLCHG